MMNILDLSLDIVTDKELIRPDENQITIGSNKKIMNDINWIPTISLETSIKDTVAYWMQ